MARTNVSTTAYELSHASKPRGRGGWAFWPAEREDELIAFFQGLAQLDWDSVVTICGTYTDAKKGLPEGDWIVLP